MVFSRRTRLNGVNKYHTERKGNREAVAVLRAHVRTYPNSVFILNKNIHLHFCWMQNYIKCCFAKLQEIITDFTSNTKQYFHVNEQNLCVNR